jgi:outer membrane protein OmpA-like peptidoglycan-associated protein
MRPKAIVLHELPGLRTADPLYAFATRIQFAFDSYQLPPEAHQLLDTLAAVLQDPLMRDKVVRIEGHTDSVGSEDYNLVLSSKRAVAVQHYLSARHSLALERLPTLGKGKFELYDLNHPTDARNRRVQFVNVSDSGGVR